MKRSAKSKKAGSQRDGGITRITVAGYKSIVHEQSVQIRPLTVLAGVNSSGKSSVMQPILLLKQTLEAGYDPGPILLNGPNVKFTSGEQLLSRAGKKISKAAFYVGLELNSDTEMFLFFKRSAKGGFEIEKLTYAKNKEEITLAPGMKYDCEEVFIWLPHPALSAAHIPGVLKKVVEDGTIKLVVARNRCFLSIEGLDIEQGSAPAQIFQPGSNYDLPIRSIIHLPGLRGNPERTYPVTAVGPIFPGTFEKYVASIIMKWQADKSEKIEKLSSDLGKLGLTWKVAARPIDQTQVELQVGRLLHAARGGAHDQVSIADVGFGVSQTLPVLVALHAAEPGQLVYLEQPEIHLHPRAQAAMAEVLADAAKRGVRVVAETHSSLLLLAIQALVAEGKLSPELVKLHWFKRGSDGVTTITSADLDDSGAFGEDWPEDFSDIELQAQSRYLDSVASRKKKTSRAG